METRRGSARSRGLEAGIAVLEPEIGRAAGRIEETRKSIMAAQMPSVRHQATKRFKSTLSRRWSSIPYLEAMSHLFCMRRMAFSDISLQRSFKK